MKKLKMLTIVLVVILITMIAFGGIYIQKQNRMENIIKNYSYAMDLKGARNIRLKVNQENKTVIKDSEGKEVESSEDLTDDQIKEKGYTYNSQESQKEENYKESKRIIEERLKSLKITDYNIKIDESTGDILLEIAENDNTDSIVSNIGTVGKFEIIDSETNEVLLDNSSIKSSKVLYNTTQSGTSVYLEISFDKNGKNKLEEISKTYVKSENNTTENTTSEDTNSTEEKENNTEETNTTSENSTSTEKKITMKIDDDEIMSTSFDETITTGKIQLSVGQASTDSSTVQGYVKQAQNVATVLDTGKLPVKYDVEKNQYVLSNISKQDLIYVAIAMAVVAIIGIIVLIVKYKTNGLLAGISYIGLSALYLIAIRYTNVTISIDSIFAIGIILILNYIFTNMLLSNIRKMNDSKVENAVGKSVSETYKKFFMRIIPICVVVITFCFANWIPMNSFGMTAFWGIAIIAIYNAIITNGLLRIKNK